MNRLLFLLILGAPASGWAQDRWERQVHERLQRAINALSSSGRSPMITRSGTLNKEESALVAATLREGIPYAVVGVCDDDCARLQLTLTSPTGSDLVQDRDSENLPTLRFTPTRTDTYRIRIVMEDCHFNPCWYAVAVVPQASPP